jgi:sigma-B regulation protein RsbU (phosphoserine phosphatase)
MSTQTVLRLVNKLAGETPFPGTSSQAAFVRALVDEVERHHPADAAVAPLREQLGDELGQLVQLIERSLGVPPAVVQGRPVDVLIVDDEDDARDAVAMAVGAFGYPVRTARDADEALRELAREPAAIVLSDWFMPGMSGLDLCAALKQRGPASYFILATGFHESPLLLEAVRGGVDDFLRKPLDLDELEARLVSASRLIRSLRAVEALRSRMEPSSAA